MGSILLVSCAGWGDVCDQGACDGGTDGGTDGGGDVTVDAPADAPPGCDPKVQNCIDDAKGIFVDSAGSDAATGTRGAPVATIGKALELAKAQSRPDVYVCAGSYPEQVDIGSPVALLGGFACGDWTYDPKNDATVGPPSGLALHVHGTSAQVSDLKMVSADGTKPGESSVAVLVESSTVSLLRASLTAGKGVAGAAGKAGSNYTAVAQTDPSIKGKDATGTTGGGLHACTLCTDGKNSAGGSGGTGGAAPGDGTDGTPNLGGTFPTDGKGGAKDTGLSCKNGDKGASGGTGPAAPAGTALGTLDASGWTPASGAAGTNGGVAQGGGGGGGGIDGTNTTGGGGGGGCGGCGGGAGGGGMGGGASVALAVVSSTVTLTSSELHATAAGAGGAGAAGQGGQAGGFSGQNSNPGCSGGTGGTGGTGGAGAGGAGGLSVGVLWKGAAAPTLDASTTSAITFAQQGGAKGTGGVPGTNDGPAGVAQAVLEVK